MADRATKTAREIMGRSDDDEEAALFIACALRDERERCALAICADCRDGKPREGGMHLAQPGTKPGKWACKAAAIWADGGEG